MKAYHFLRADMTTGYGKELPWTVGEERIRNGPLKLCKTGYYWAPSWYDALQNAPGPVACIVDVDEPEGSDLTDVDSPERPDLWVSRSGTSRRQRLDAAYDASRELRLFGYECAERALMRERGRGREPDTRSWAVIQVARWYAWGKATTEELAIARAAAWAATWDASSPAALTAARSSERAAVRDVWIASRAAARNAWVAEYDWHDRYDQQHWQRGRLAEILDAVVVHPKGETP